MHGSLVKPIYLAGLVVLFSSLHGGTDCQAASTQRISFRLAKPRSVHFDTATEADAQLKTLIQLGCDAKQHQHDGHIDVRYNCPQWQTITVKDAGEVAQWQDWLRGKGFAVVHNTPTATHTEVVKYRLDKWRSFHFHKPEQVASHLALFKMLGCEVKQSKHNGHEDVSVRCPSWQSIGLASHTEAHQWETALKNLGFVTVHEH